MKTQKGTMRLYRSITYYILFLLLPGLAACGGGATTAQQDPPTPTPLPPAPALERPTYEVERGTIERTIDPNGRVTPVDMVQLAFRRSGRVEFVNVKRDDEVREGDVLAQLFQDEELENLAEAEDTLVQAQRDLETAHTQKEKQIQRAQMSLEKAQRALEDAREEKEDEIEQAERDLQDAHRALGRLLPGGEEDMLEEAQEELEQAQREEKDTEDQYSLEKTRAEHALIDAANALEEAQQAYSDAYWDKVWIEEHGTDPQAIEQVDPETGETHEHHPDLDDEEKREYYRAFDQAEEDLAAAERELELQQRALELAREEERYQNQDIAEDTTESEEKVDRVVAGDEEQLIEQQRAVEDKQIALQEAQERDFLNETQAIEDAHLELEEARDETFNTELKAVERAERELAKTRKEVANGQIIAPQNGQVIAISMSEGDQVEEFDPVMEIADPTLLEVAADLSGENMRQLAEGQPAEVSLLSRPDVIMPAVIRRMPAPYGSGGTGIVQEEDKSTRFEILDTKGQELKAGAVVRIRIVLERKEDVLILPLEAIRSFEGRTFVVVREGERERRVPIETGIETEDMVEIVEGLEAGDIVVGL
jgi:multidrug efflux pump subunit AcrA (membrane-fusion protein)